MWVTSPTKESAIKADTSRSLIVRFGNKFNERSNRTHQRSHVAVREHVFPPLLSGLLFDDTGQPLVTTHAKAHGRRYRYYVSKPDCSETNALRTDWRLPAHDLEARITESLVNFFRNDDRVHSLFGAHANDINQLNRITNGGQSIGKMLQGNDLNQVYRLLRLIINRIILKRSQIDFEFDRDEVCVQLGIDSSQGSSEFTFSEPLLLKRRGQEQKLIVGAVSKSTPDEKLNQLIAKAVHWRDEYFHSQTETINSIARREDIHASEVGRIISVAFLAPDIANSIVEGRQPVDLNIEKLRQHIPLPLNWDEQRRLLGFSSGNTA